MDDEIDAAAEEYSRLLPGVSFDHVAPSWRITLISRYITSGMGEVSRRHRLSINDLYVLNLMQLSVGQQLRPTDLSKRLLLTNAAVTGCLDRLSEVGLVERVWDPADKRTLVVHITEKGKALAVELLAEVGRQTRFAGICGEMSADALERLNDELRRLLDAIRDAQPSP